MQSNGSAGPGPDGDLTGEDRLEAFFAAARAEGRGETPSDDLMARILADAVAEARVQSHAATRVAGGGQIRRILRDAADAVLGGWPAAAALTAVALIGVAIGLNAPPSGLESLLDENVGQVAPGEMLVAFDIYADGG